MDRAEAINILEDGEWWSRLDDSGEYAPAFDALHDALDMAIAALREQEQREKNEPLTLEQLKRMDGEPVWIADGRFWALVRVDHNVKLIANDHETANAEGWIKHIGPIYLYKPGGADHE